MVTLRVRYELWQPLMQLNTVFDQIVFKLRSESQLTLRHHFYLLNIAKVGIEAS